MYNEYYYPPVPVEKKKKKSHTKIIMVIFFFVLLVGILSFGSYKLFIEKKEFTVTFETNTEVNYSKVVVSKNDYIIEPDTPRKAGYRFIGWYDGDELYDFNKKVTKDIKLEARWEEVRVTAIYLNPRKKTVKLDGKSMLKASVVPDDAFNKKILWSSSDPDIVSVLKDGTIEGKSIGTATITATSEDGGFTATCEVTVSNDSVSVKGVTIDILEETLTVGDELLLTPIFEPEDATNTNVTWESSDSSIAKVSDDGKVTALKAGMVNIIVTTEDGGYKSASKITVKAPVANTVTPTGLKLNKNSATINAGDTVELKATVSPSNATNKTVAWSSSDTSVATVDTNGKVKGKKAGKAVITAKTKSGGITATATITVKENNSYVPVSSITLNHASVTAKVGSSFQLTATVKPDNATDKNITWKAMNESVAKIDQNGKVTAVGVGSTTLVAYTSDGVKQTCLIKVEEVAVSNITLNSTSRTLSIGEEYTLTATVSPNNATNKTVTWTSTDTSVATVDSNGKVKAISTGSTTIKATAGTKSATCTITVGRIEPTGITLNTTNTSLIINDSIQLVATVKPANATNKDVSWNSSNSSIAYVDSYGKVTARSPGTAMIYAVSKSNGVKATATIYVNPPVLSLSGGGTVKVGQQIYINAVTKPAGYSIIWTSASPSIASVSNGYVHGNSPGETEIMARMTVNGYTVTASTHVLVIN